MKTMKIMGSDCHLQHLQTMSNGVHGSVVAIPRGALVALSLCVSLSFLFDPHSFSDGVWGLLECSEQGPLNGRDQSRGEHLATQQC